MEESAAARLVNTRRGPVELALFGEGPPVMALHGAMGGHDQGILLARAVGAPGFRYLAISRPGYLGTGLAVGRTPEEQADLCAEVLDALAVDRAGVIAVSGGGPTAIQFALRHPRRCLGLVLVSAASARIDSRLPLSWHIMKLVARWPGVVSAMRRQAARDPARAARRSILDPALRARTLEDPVAGPLLAALQASAFDRLAARLPGTENDIAQTRAALAYPLEQIAAPVLVVHGSSDRMVPVAQARALAARAPRAELLEIEHGEHVVIFTHLGLVRGCVARFLRAHAAPAADASSG